MVELIMAIALWPFMAIFGFGVSLEIYYFYCPIQVIALSLTYFLRKKKILKSGLPLIHYIIGFIIGHVVYVIIVFQGIMHRGFMP